MKIEFVVPGPPVASGRARSRRYRDKDGQPQIMHHPPRKTADERVAVRQFASVAMGNNPPMTGALELRACWYRAVPAGFSKRRSAEALAGAALPIKRPDLDNYERLLDSLQGIVWLDDAQITDMHLFKRFSDKPRVVIHVMQIGSHE